MIINPFMFGAPAATDPYFANVVLLLHCDGVNDSTTFTDSSSAARTFTTFGNAKIDTSQYKFGGVSGKFDGSGDHITAPSSTDFNFGTGDFTIETWIRFNVFPAASGTIVGNYPGTWALQYRPDQGNKITLYDGSANYSGALSLSTATWYHFAVTRAGTSLRFFVDGVQSGSTLTNSTNFSTANTLCVGQLNGLGQEVNGWLDDMRITKGVARYTASFTPPIAAFPNS